MKPRERRVLVAVVAAVVAAVFLAVITIVLSCNFRFHPFTFLYVVLLSMISGATRALEDLLSLIYLNPVFNYVSYVHRQHFVLLSVTHTFSTTGDRSSDAMGQPPLVASAGLANESG